MIKQEVKHYAEGRPRKVMVGKLTREGGDIRFDKTRFTDLPTDHFYPLLNHGSGGFYIHASLEPVVDRVNVKLVHVIHHILDLRWYFKESQ